MSGPNRWGHGAADFFTSWPTNSHLGKIGKPTLPIMGSILEGPKNRFSPLRMHWAVFQMILKILPIKLEA